MRSPLSVFVCVCVFVCCCVLSNGALLTRVPSFSVFFSQVRRFVMGRRGWASVAAPAGWYEVIRERPAPPVPDPATEVQRLQHQLAQAQAPLLQHGSTAVSPGSTAKRPRRREDFVCSCTEEVIEWISDRQMDIQEEIARGNAVEVARLSSLVVQAATSLQPPTFHGCAICPIAREFLWSGKRDDSMIGRSARSANMGTGAFEWERQATQDHRNLCCGDEAHSPFLSFGMWFPESNSLRCLQLLTATRSHFCTAKFVHGSSQRHHQDMLRSGFHLHVPLSWILSARHRGSTQPTSVSDVDHESILDHGDSTFLDNFERDLGVQWWT